MASVSSILTYPEKDEPGQTVDSVAVGPEGLDGDRRKKAAVHLVAASEYVEAHPRANLVVDVEPGELLALVGRRVRVGSVELEVTGTAKNCPGVYADVARAGTLDVGDEITVGVPGT